MTTVPYPFDAETWALLPGYFDKLLRTVHLHVWGSERETEDERETAVLCRTLAEHFEKIQFRIFPRRVTYDYYPVIGVMGEDEAVTEGPRTVDYGVRIVGWPGGYQLTSLITAIQVVSFRGQTLEPKTRIQLRGLKQEVSLQILTAADNETGALVAKTAFALCVAHEQVRAYLIMADRFPEAMIKFSVNRLPHTIINGRYHVDGPLSEEDLLKHIARAVK
jgi:alkyl hydroperoxide reductase subunit AhpF